MIDRGIEILWSGAREFVPIDFNNLAEHEDIRLTVEWWPAEKCVVSYVALGKFTPKGDGWYELKISYEKSKNERVADGAEFGISTIRLNKTARSGEAFWHGVGKKPEVEPAKWKRVELDPGKERKRSRQTVTRIERKQEMFRQLLLDRYRCCAITKETTPSALDAAHVIAASKNGHEVLGNGILLRADIHRLYDSGAFSFAKDGKINITKGFALSDAYRKLLSGARLSPELLSDLAR